GTDFGTRGRRADEAIDVMRALWAGGPPDGASYHGEFFRFERAMSYPRPVRPGGIPIHIGGHSLAAARRAGRRGDGLQPLGLAGDELRRVADAMPAEAERAGRGPEALEPRARHVAARVTTEGRGKT